MHMFIINIFVQLQIVSSYHLKMDKIVYFLGVFNVMILLVSFNPDTLCTHHYINVWPYVTILILCSYLPDPIRSCRVIYDKCVDVYLASYKTRTTGNTFKTDVITLLEDYEVF